MAVVAWGEKFVFSQYQLDQLEKLSPLLTDKQLADFFDIHIQTFYKVINRQEEVMTYIERGRSKMISLVGQKLIDKALEGDMAAISLYLKCKGGWRDKDPDIKNIENLHLGNNNKKEELVVRYLYENPKDQGTLNQQTTTLKDIKE